jgi:hypothetical protein
MLEKMKPLINILFMGLLAGALVIGYDCYKTSEPVAPPENQSLIILDDVIQIEIGELGRLSVDKSKGVSFVWKCLPAGINYKEYKSGRELVFSSGTLGDYLCVVSSARDGEVEQKIIKIKVVPQGTKPLNPDDPQPPTPPTPPKPPKPVVPGLPGQVIGWSATVISPGKAMEASNLADAFSAVAVQMEAGAAITADDVAEATRDATHSALGAALPAWTGFLKNLESYLHKERMKGTLVTVEDHVRIWKEIASGLKQVK